MKPTTPYRRIFYLGLALSVILLVAFRLALPALVKNYVNKKLNELPGYSGHVADIHIALFRGAYEIESLVLKKKTDPANFPFLQIRHIDLSLEWRALFKGRLVGRIIANQPKINILATEELAQEPSKESWTKTVKALMPITIDKLVISNGQFAYIDLTKKPNVNLHIDKMQLTALNLANVQKTNDPLPSSATLSGSSIGGGRLKASMRINALKNIPDFNLQLRLSRVNLVALNGFLQANLKFDIERGDLDIFSQLKLTNSELDGYVKPFIKDLKVLNVKKDIKKKGGVLRVVKKAVIGLFAKAVQNPKTKKDCYPDSDKRKYK